MKKDGRKHSNAAKRKINTRHPLPAPHYPISHFRLSLVQQAPTLRCVLYVQQAVPWSLFDQCILTLKFKHVTDFTMQRNLTFLGYPSLGYPRSCHVSDDLQRTILSLSGSNYRGADSVEADLLVHMPLVAQVRCRQRRPPSFIWRHYDHRAELCCFLYNLSVVYTCICQ